MPRCHTCGNDYAKSFEVLTEDAVGEDHTRDALTRLPDSPLSEAAGITNCHRALAISAFEAETMQVSCADQCRGRREYR